MRHIDRGPEPDSWREFKRKNRAVRYADLDATQQGRIVRREMRSHLVKSQHGLCAYCCSRITAESGSSLTEHIKPESLFPRETMDYGNLVASCTHPDSCGCAKGNVYEGRFVSPLENDCHRHFRFYPDGSVAGLDDRGEWTCDLLQLNTYRLRQARRALYESLSWASEGYIREYCLTPREGGELEQFADMLQQMCERGLFPAP